MTRDGHMPFGEYQAIDAVNMSSLVWMAISPKHYQYHKANPRPDAAHYRVGRGTHTAILEPMQFLHEYRLLEKWPDFKSKAAQDWRDEQEAEDRTVLTQKQYRTIERMRDAALADPIAAPFLRGGRHECVLQWRCPRTGLPLKGRLDYVGIALTDIKTSRHALPAPFARDAGRLLYPARLAFYQEGLRVTTGKTLPVKIVAIENTPPHDVSVYDVPDEALDAGRRRYEGWLDDLRMSMDADDWPGVSKGREQVLQPEAWTAPLQSDPITQDGESLF